MEPESLTRLINKFNDIPYLEHPRMAMSLVTGIYGAITADMAMGVSPALIVRAADAMLFPLIVTRGWDQEWKDTVDTIGPEHIEDVLCSMAQGERNLEMSAWNDLGDGVTMTVRMEAFPDEAGVCTGMAMEARGWNPPGNKKRKICKMEDVVIEIRDDIPSMELFQITFELEEI